MFNKFYGYMERIASGIERLYFALLEIIKLLYVLIEGKPGENPPDPPEPPEPPDTDWSDWWTRPMEEWPTHVEGIRVGYVRVNVMKCPLYEVKNTIPLVYQDDALREGNTTDAKRIIAKLGRWIMVFAHGDTWGSGIDDNVRPFGQDIDGDDLYYRVMNEQIIDGIPLWELNKVLFVPYRHISNTYINE
jgi:hypothetical protein